MKSNRNKLKNSTPALKRYNKTEVKEILPYMTRNVGWRAKMVEDKLVWTGKTDYPSYSVRYDLDRTLYLSTPIDKSIEPLTSLRITFKVDELETGESQGVIFGTEVQSLDNGDYVYKDIIDTVGEKEYIVNQKGVFWPDKDIMSLDNHLMSMEDYKQYYYLPGISLNTVDHVVLSDIKVMPINAWLPKPAETKLSFNPLVDADEPSLENTRSVEVFYVKELLEFQDDLTNMEILSATKQTKDVAGTPRYTLLGLINDSRDAKGPYISIRVDAKYIPQQGILEYGPEVAKVYGLHMDAVNVLTREDLVWNLNNNVVVIHPDVHAIPEQDLLTYYGGFYVDTDVKSVVVNKFNGFVAYKSILKRATEDYIEVLKPIMEYFMFIQREDIPPYVPGVPGRPGSRDFPDETGTYYKIDMVGAGEFENWVEISEAVPESQKSSAFSDIYTAIEMGYLLEAPSLSCRIKTTPTVTTNLDLPNDPEMKIMLDASSSTIPGSSSSAIYSWVVTGDKTFTSSEPVVQMPLKSVFDSKSTSSAAGQISLTITSIIDDTFTCTATKAISIVRPGEITPVAVIKCDNPDLGQLTSTSPPITFNANSSSTDPDINYDYTWTFTGGSSTITRSGVSTTVSMGDIAGTLTTDFDFKVTLEVASRSDPTKTSIASVIGSISFPVESTNSVVAGFTEGYASISRDGGGNWSILPKGLNCGSTISSIRALTASGNIIVAGLYYGYASRSVDAGNTWNQLPRGLNSGSISETVWALASAGDVFVAGFNSGYASISRDKGKTWNTLTKGLNCGNTNSSIWSLAASGNTFIAGMNSGYASISKNRGETWSRLPRGLNGHNPYGTIYSLVASGDTFIAGSVSGSISISRDGGTTWTGKSLGTPTNIPGTVLSLSSIGNVFIAGTETGHAFISKDGGYIWTELPMGLDSEEISRTKAIRTIISTGNTFIAGKDSGYASISFDKGENWRALPRGLSSGSVGNIQALAAVGVK